MTDILTEPGHTSTPIKHFRWSRQPRWRSQHPACDPSPGPTCLLPHYCLPVSRDV